MCDVYNRQPWTSEIDLCNVKRSWIDQNRPDEFLVLMNNEGCSSLLTYLSLFCHGRLNLSYNETTIITELVIRQLLLKVLWVYRYYCDIRILQWWWSKNLFCICMNEKRIIRTTDLFVTFQADFVIFFWHNINYGGYFITSALASNITVIIWTIGSSYNLDHFLIC